MRQGKGFLLSCFESGLILFSPNSKPLVVKDGFGFLMPLPPPPEGWDYRCAPPRAVFCSARDGTRASSMAGKQSTK